ncbi:hypothetical protein PR048_026774 [Dryococelus australis]|uniref:Uncharacterized protein n=1 Tax=Dryococelus australis TaxID=614101 RepID=A0ABQ9GMC1_9NEOP|nr:hypothetical protein PR048_026774 [Dryococelus australis]
MAYKNTKWVCLPHDKHQLRQQQSKQQLTENACTKAWQQATQSQPAPQRPPRNAFVPHWARYRQPQPVNAQNRNNWLQSEAAFPALANDPIPHNPTPSGA